MSLPPAIKQKWEGARVHQKGRPKQLGRVEELRYRGGRYLARITWDKGGHALVHVASLAIVEEELEAERPAVDPADVSWIGGAS